MGKKIVKHDVQLYQAVVDEIEGFVGDAYVRNACVVIELPFDDDASAEEVLYRVLGAHAKVRKGDAK